MRTPATLIRLDDSDDPSTPVEYALVTGCGGHVEVGRMWLDEPAGEWVALTPDKTAAPLGRFARGFDAAAALLVHHDLQQDRQPPRRMWFERWWRP